MKLFATRINHGMANRLLLWITLCVFSCARIESAERQQSQKANGNIEGVITFSGEISKSSIPDDAGLQREVIEVDGKSRGLRNVVIYLTQTNGLPPSATSNPATNAVVDQQNHEFVPRVIAVQQGQPVAFSNSDPANHNVRTIALVAKNDFNVFTGADGKYEHRFVVQPEYRPIRLGCDIHPWMQGWIYVFDHPWFAVTDERGRFRISQLPPGEYQLHIVQPDIKHREQRNITVKANEIRKIETIVRPSEAK